MSSANFRSNRRRPCPWSVFDAVRSFPSTPDALMSEIDAAIASTEYTRSTTSTTLEQEEQEEEEEEEEEIIAKKRSPAETEAASTYDAQIADEAYKAACAALAAKRPDAALSSLYVALESCPPDKLAAIAKLRSLLAIANAQLHKRQQHKHHPTPN